MTAEHSSAVADLQALAKRIGAETDRFVTEHGFDPERRLAHLRTRLPFGGSPTEAIARLASAMNHIGGLELEPVHYFSEGLYARELTMPAGALVVSHIHRTAHVCTCSRGRITVFQTDGVGTRTIEAPFTFVSTPGQRVGYAHEETVWTSYHPTDERDLEKIEAMLYDKREFPDYIEGDAETLLGWIEQLPLLESGL